MVDKCPHCQGILTRYPVKLQPEKSLMDNYKEGTIAWKNLFKIDAWSLLIFLIVLLMVIGYKLDMAKCDKVIDQPCTFCMDSGCCDGRLDVCKVIQAEKPQGTKEVFSYNNG